MVHHLNFVKIKDTHATDRKRLIHCIASPLSLYHSTPQQHQVMPPTQVIVAIDIGSSSVRCSAFKYDSHQQQDGTVNPSVQALENCQAQRSVRSVQPNTGKIRLLSSEEGEDDNNNSKSLMDHLDDCMDEVLDKVRRNQQQQQSSGYEIVAVGFSAFVMNLVGVDAQGGIVGDEASISYACNTQSVARQCRKLRM